MTNIGLHATPRALAYTCSSVNVDCLICLIVMMNVDRVNVLRARAFEYVANHIDILYYVHIPVYDYDGMLVVMLGKFFICVFIGI